VPTSISSSNRRLPKLEWRVLLGTALAATLLLAGTMELRLALRGYQPTVVDAPDLWQHERHRAAALGSRALILVGASRIQLDVDLDVLRRKTGLEPVQLGIEGSDFQPVLADLAADPRVRGTIIVDFADHLLGDSFPGAAPEWVARAAAEERGSRLPDFRDAEDALVRLVRSRMRSYADGARPISSLRDRLIPSWPAPQYIITGADRSQWADYSRLPMPWFYYKRVMRNLGVDIPLHDGMRAEDVEEDLRRRVSTLVPLAEKLPRYEASTRALAAQTAALRARGGKVYFVMFPKSGLVKEIDRRRFPREQFWDRFVALVGAPTLHFEDVPAMRDLVCPDGSHLDYRQRAAFTAALVQALGIAGERTAKDL
jgi:hypothetical protein